MAASTLTSGSVLIEGICLTIAEGRCGSMSRLWILIWNQSQVLEPWWQGVFLVFILQVLGGIQTGPFTLRFFSFMPLQVSTYLLQRLHIEAGEGDPTGINIWASWWLSGKESPAMQEMWVRSLGWEDPLEKGMATLSSILAREIPWTEEPSGLMESMKSLRVGNSWACMLGVFILIPLDIMCFIIEEKYIFHFFAWIFGKESACNAGDPSSIPGLGGAPGEGKGYPLQYSGLKNPMDRVVHGVTKSRIQFGLSFSHFHTFTFEVLACVMKLVPSWCIGQPYSLLRSRIINCVCEYMKSTLSDIMPTLRSTFGVILLVGSYLGRSPGGISPHLVLSLSWLHFPSPQWEFH